MCPLGGVLIYSSVYHIATFCGDDTYTLPLHQPIHISLRTDHTQELTNTLTVIHYSLPHVATMTFAFKVHRVYKGHYRLHLTNPCAMFQQFQLASVQSSELLPFPKMNNDTSLIYANAYHKNVLITFFKTYKHLTSCSLTMKEFIYYKLDILPLTGNCNEFKHQQQQQKLPSEHMVLYKHYQKCHGTCSQHSECPLIYGRQYELFKGSDWPHVFVIVELEVFITCVYREERTRNMSFEMENTEGQASPVKVYKMTGLCLEQILMLDTDVKLWMNMADLEIEKPCERYSIMRYFIRGNDNTNFEVIFIRFR